VVAATLTGALSLFSVIIIIVFIWILCKIESQLSINVCSSRFSTSSIIHSKSHPISWLLLKKKTCTSVQWFTKT
jgi:hypothetical protein